MVRSTPRAVIDVRGVSVLRDGAALLDDVDWCVRAGECWAVLGPNGAGKSTLLALLTGDTWATSGTVHVLGHRLGSVDVRRLRRAVGLVSHRVADRVRPTVRVRALLHAGARGALAPGLEERRADRPGAGVLDHLVAREAARLGLAHLLDRAWGACSQGERQRVLLARARVARACTAEDDGLVVLDEATAGLDLAGRELVLRALEQEDGATPHATATVVVAHHLEDLPATTSHALLLREGRVVAAGPARRVLAETHLAAAFGVDVRVRRTAAGRWGTD